MSISTLTRDPEIIDVAPPQITIARLQLQYTAYSHQSFTMLDNYKIVKEGVFREQRGAVFPIFGRERVFCFLERQRKILNNYILPVSFWGRIYVTLSPCNGFCYGRANVWHRRASAFSSFSRFDQEEVYLIYVYRILVGFKQNAYRP